MKAVTMGVLASVISGHVLAQQNPSGPGQIQWPVPGGQVYPDPGRYSAPAYNAQPYNRYGRGYYAPPTYYEYVAPPGSDWPSAVYGGSPGISPDVLLKEPNQGAAPAPSGYPRPIGFEAGESIQVIPPPNIALPVGEQLRATRMTSGSDWRPQVDHAAGRMVSQ